MTDEEATKLMHFWNGELRAGRLSHVALGDQITCCDCQREIGEHQKFKIIDRMRAAHLICEAA